VPIIKRKLTTHSGEREDVVPEWSIGKENPVNMLGIKYTSSDSSGGEGLGDKVYTIWLLRYEKKLIESRESMFDELREYKEETKHGYVLTKR
jgi:hypothetical protein